MRIKCFRLKLMVKNWFYIYYLYVKCFKCRMYVSLNFLWCLRPRSNYCFLLLLFFFPPFKNCLYCKTTKLCIYWSRRCSLDQVDQKKFLHLSVIFFSTWLLYGCVLNVHSFNGTYLQLWYLKMYKGYIVYIDLLKFHCHGWLTLVAMESSIIHHHLGRNKNISICVKIEQKHNKVCTLFYS